MVISRAPPRRPATPTPSNNSGDKLLDPPAAGPASSISSTNLSRPGVRAVSHVKAMPPSAPIAAFRQNPRDKGGTRLATNTALAAPVAISMMIKIRKSGVNIAHPIDLTLLRSSAPRSPDVADRPRTVCYSRKPASKEVAAVGPAALSRPCMTGGGWIYPLTGVAPRLAKRAFSLTASPGAISGGSVTAIHASM